MDFLLLIAGWIMMYNRNYVWLFAIIIVLCSTYLQLPLDHETSVRLMIGPEHNVADTGLLLYFTFFFTEITHKGINLRHPMANPVCLFFLFLLLNGMWDILTGVAFGDVVRYLRNWALLTVVFIPYKFHIQEIKDTIRIIFWITFALSVVLSLQYMVGAAWLGRVTAYGEYVRGAKPPSTAIICFCLALLNVFHLRSKVRVLTCLVLAMPVIFCMKMSYFATICLTLLVCYRLMSSNNLQKIVKYGIGALIGVIVLFSAFPVFYDRFQDTINQSDMTSQQKKEGNFIYRINHFEERLEYVLEEPSRSLRGLGYIQERNFKERPFKYGQENILGHKAMLDTGDIAWSILILRLGFVGIIMYLLMYAKCLRCLWNDRYQDSTTMTYFAYTLVALVFMSLGNTLIADSEFFLIPLLLISTQYENSTLHLES